MYCRHRVQSMLLVLLAVVTLCRGQLDVTPVEMQTAVDTLAARFSTIRNEGLGIDQLEVKPVKIICIRMGGLLELK